MSPGIPGTGVRGLWFRKPGTLGSVFCRNFGRNSRFPGVRSVSDDGEARHWADARCRPPPRRRWRPAVSKNLAPRIVSTEGDLGRESDHPPLSFRHIASLIPHQHSPLPFQTVCQNDTLGADKGFQSSILVLPYAALVFRPKQVAPDRRWKPCSACRSISTFGLARGPNARTTENARSTGLKSVQMNFDTIDLTC